MRITRLMPAAITSVGLSFGLALGTATALADPDTDAQFKAEVAPYGYNDSLSAPNRTVEAGHKVCDLFARGARDIDPPYTIIKNYIIGTFGDTRDQAGYYATLFVQSAARAYCPQYVGVFGSL
jgi:hypothetical protein